MSTPGAGYDEIGSRTRQAWLRTSLGVTAVTLLVLRGLVLADAATWVLIASLLPAIVIVGLAIRRASNLQHAESEPIAARPAVGVSVSVIALAVAAGAGAAVGLMAR